MRIKTNALGCLQQQIMEIIWQSSEPLKPSEVRQKLKGEYAYTTIMTVLKRMADQKILKRRRQGKAYYYQAVKDKRGFINSNLQDVYRNLVESYGKLAIANFIDVVKTSPADLNALKEYLSASNEKSKN